MTLDKKSTESINLSSDDQLLLNRLRDMFSNCNAQEIISYVEHMNELIHKLSSCDGVIKEMRVDKIDVEFIQSMVLDKLLYNQTNDGLPISRKIEIKFYTNKNGQTDSGKYLTEKIFRIDELFNLLNIPFPKDLNKQKYKEELENSNKYKKDLLYYLINKLLVMGELKPPNPSVFKFQEMSRDEQNIVFNLFNNLINKKLIENKGRGPYLKVSDERKKSYMKAHEELENQGLQNKDRLPILTKKFPDIKNIDRKTYTSFRTYFKNKEKE